MVGTALCPVDGFVHTATVAEFFIFNKQTLGENSSTQNSERQAI
jgi:hypothetical protein